MDFLEAVKDFRKHAADAAFGGISIHPDEATRISAWLCLATSMAMLLGAWLAAFLLLMGGLIFDVVDGAVARRQGLHRPEVDWAADRYTEFAIFSAFIYRRPGPLSLAFFLLYLLNNFLPIRSMPALPLRQVFAIYLFIHLVAG